MVIEELRFLFSQFGLAESIVSDNGTCFTSSTFNSFLKQHGIAHITSAPYHPSTNGLAERSVQLVKKGLKKVKTGSFRSRIAKVLFAYRRLPQTTTGLSPSELLLGRCPRSCLDLLKPNTAERVEHKQSMQRQKHDLHSRERNFEAGDPVLVRNYHHGDKWIPGEVLRRTGPVSVCVQLHDGRSRRCHHDQIRSRTVETPNLVGVDESTLPQTPPAEIGTRGDDQLEMIPEAIPEAPQLPLDSASSEPLPEPATVRKEYPRHVRKPVIRHGYESKC